MADDFIGTLPNSYAVASGILRARACGALNIIFTSFFLCKWCSLWRKRKSDPAGETQGKRSETLSESHYLKKPERGKLGERKEHGKGNGKNTERALFAPAL